MYDKNEWWNVMWQNNRIRMPGLHTILFTWKYVKILHEGSVKNLLYMLRLSEHDVTVFWNLVTAPLHSVSKPLCNVVLKIVCNHFSQVNLIQKCLWILRKQFKFTSTKKWNCRTSCPSRIRCKFINYFIFQYCSWSTAKMLFTTMLW